MTTRIILPGDPLFDLTLFSNLPPAWEKVAEQVGQQISFVCDESGLMRPATPDELEDYLYGGEYDEVMESHGLDENL